MTYAKVASKVRKLIVKRFAEELKAGAERNGCVYLYFTHLNDEETGVNVEFEPDLTLRIPFLTSEIGAHDAPAWKYYLSDFISHELGIDVIINKHDWETLKNSRNPKELYLKFKNGGYPSVLDALNEVA